MKRDFSESAYQELLSLVKEVEDEKWCDFTDWLGDRWIDFEGWIGQLDIRKYVDNVNSYHKKVIDKNNTSAEQIDKIFEAVNQQSENYKGRFVAQLTDLRMYRQTIDRIADVIAPANGKFDPQYIGDNLKNRLASYLKKSALLRQMAGDGITEEDLQGMDDEQQLQELLETMGSTLIDLVPNVEVGQKVEIPIGPGLTFYYAVEATVDTGSDINIKTVIEDQKLKLDGISMETGGILKVGGEVNSDGDTEISISSDNSSVSFDVNGQLKGSGSIQIGNDTYTCTIIVTPDKFTLEQSVTTEFDCGSVTSKYGIEKKNNSSWQPVPVSVPVTVPYPGFEMPSIELPSIDVDWEQVGEVAVVAFVLYGVVYIGAAYFSGGTSMAVMPPPVPV